MTGISRRAFLRSAVAAAGLALACRARWVEPRADAGSDRLHLPLVTTHPTPTRSPSPTPGPGLTPTPGPASLEGHVVHVHAAGATYWDYGHNYYGDYVNQDVVNAMMDAGVRALTGLGSADEAWRAIVPGYVPGRGIAIKVNMNNCYHCDLPRTSCEEWQLVLDALIHPVNAIVNGLHRAYPTLDEADIWVYEATIGGNAPHSRRRIPARMIAGCRYPRVRFLDMGCHQAATYDSTSPSAMVVWRPPAGIPAPPAMQVTDVLVNATYVINLPIMRRHGSAGITLGFKNHLGSVANCSVLHPWVFQGGDHLAPTTYSPLIDLYMNANIAAKTVLVVGDGLYGNWKDNTSKSAPWRTFGGRAANSLFLATDPVAVDCVMADLLNAEAPLLPMSDGYLQLAERAGLGVYERGDPWGAGYSRIRYVRVEV